MTENRPTLIINRLVVRAGETIAYDERFHHGLNILRGRNSSGKSTILDFIFFILGGDVSVWKTAASKCTDVSAEVELSGTTITLQRKVTVSAKAPLSIYWGPLEESRKHNLENWSEYPYAARGKDESFSKVLFRALGYPEVRSDLETNITMHQILRLIYVDQISRTTSLMREEDFDSPLTRKTIAELLFGVFDDTLYKDQIDLRLRERELKDVKQQLIHAEDIIQVVDKKLDDRELRARVAKSHSELEKINSAIEETETTEKNISDTSLSDTEKLRKHITKLKFEEAQIKENIEMLQVDILDSDIFIKSLESRATSIDESLATRDAIGDLPNCPLCNIPVESEDGEIRCQFSKKSIPGDFGRSTMLKMREELRFQLQESRELQEDREKQLRALLKNLDEATARIRLQLRSYKQRLSSVKSSRDNRLDTLFQEKGRLEAEISNSLHLQKYLDALTILRKRQAELKGFIHETEERIRAKHKKQNGRLSIAYNDIRENVISILSKDVDRQEEFKMIERLDLQFAKNTYLLNGRNNFSASSNAMLKNAIHFAILFASTEDNEFRYPRFILCDNAEDGGMEKGRSQNFQRIIAEMSQTATKPFQVILSTSMIHPDLEGSNLCVGPPYSRDNKSLKLPPDLQIEAISPEPSPPESTKGGKREH